MRVAVLADVHANLPALEAVLRSVDALHPDAIFCLGDLVGYNAHPAECIQLIRERANVVVLGNHDRAITHGNAGPGTRSVARQVHDWSRAQLDDAALSYLAELPTRVVEGSLVAVHGCYLNDDHYYGYVTSTMLEANLRVLAERDDLPSLALAGHTHVPMIGWLSREEVFERRLDGAVSWPSSANAVLINPGAVGQPRDGDPRAAYALIDVERRRAEVRRVQYDVGAAAAAIHSAGLDPSLAERLRRGR